jgi:hypothetical protein
VLSFSSSPDSGREPFEDRLITLTAFSNLDKQQEIIHEIGCSLRKNQKIHFPKKWLKWKTTSMVQSESAPQELSNEWSCQYDSTILIFWGDFCVPFVTLTEVTITLSPYYMS